MHCTRHYPSQSLQPYIAWYWTLESKASSPLPAIYRLVPDGYVDWVFHLETPWWFSQHNKNLSKQQLQAHLFGHTTSYIELEIKQFPLKVFGIKFQPWAACLFWNTNMHDTTNHEIALADLSLQFHVELKEKIQASNNTNTRIQAVESLLLQQIKASNFTTNLLLQPTVKLETIKANFNNRRIQQRFKQEIGISPKIYFRTIRINQVIQSMLANRYKLTDLAYQHNYFDQSHFIRDFKSFTGLSPSTFLKSIQPSEDFFNLRIVSDRTKLSCNNFHSIK